MFEKITDTIYAITDGKTVGNVGMIATETGNFVIDTSMFPVMARDIRNAVNNTRTGKLKASFFTHYHFDHTAGNQHFHDAPMYAHSILQDNFMNFYKSKEDEMISNFADREDGHLFEGLVVTPMTKIFNSVELIPEEDSSITLMHVGGHTTGSTIIHYKPENVLFSGDNIFAGVFPGGHDPTSDPYQWLEALKVMKDLNPTTVIPGHGYVHEGTTEIDSFSNYLTKFIDMGKKLAADSTDFEHAVAELSEIEYYDELFPTMKERSIKNWYGVVQSRI